MKIIRKLRRPKRKQSVRPTQNEYRKRVPARLHLISVIAKTLREPGSAGNQLARVGDCARLNRTNLMGHQRDDCNRPAIQGGKFDFVARRAAMRQHHRSDVARAQPVFGRSHARITSSSSLIMSNTDLTQRREETKAQRDFLDFNFPRLCALASLR